MIYDPKNAMPEEAPKKTVAYDPLKNKPVAYDPLEKKPTSIVKKIPTPDSGDGDNKWSTPLTEAPKGSLLLVSDRFNYLNYSKNHPNL